ncbi:transposase family protein [Microbispora rosea]|uniref:transposase family protein n=1 Tax=Microbispora rosea TaxID=58117 RepID=UPI0036C42A55
MTGRKAARNKPLTPAQKQVNQLISVERAPVEHGFADLKGWRILTKLRLDAAQATKLLRALLVLTTHEINRWRMILGHDYGLKPGRASPTELTQGLLPGTSGWNKPNE